MNSFGKDYRKLYLLQDKFLAWWPTFDLPFYLTDGTALGRYYLNHRYSEDLDFFVNADKHYLDYISKFKNKIGSHFAIDLQQTLFSDDYTRLFLTEEGVILKIELVNDVDYYPGVPAECGFGLIDKPLNILANKLTAIIGRDEPKDIFDIIHISLNYSFNWQDVFNHAKRKSVINEIDVERQLYSFPIDWLENVNWLNTPFDKVSFQKSLNQISNDFLFGSTNSLGINQMPIELAKPFLKA